MPLDLIHTSATSAGAQPQGMTPGRSCPLHYRYPPEAFAEPASAPLRELEVLYVVGGLYGNEPALERVLALFEAETGRKRLVFNGDFHWFDVHAPAFDRVQRRVLEHIALRGNVETELAGDEVADVGCGCAYPDWVGDEVVQRSNRIMGRLRRATTPAQRQALAALPMWLRADVGDFKLGIVHGDAQSLAGWGFAQEHLRDATHRAEVADWCRRAQVDAFACTHTCLPVFQRLRARGQAGRAHWIFNNGATGMPNFTGDGAGLLTRIALTPLAGAERRFGMGAGIDNQVHVDAMAVDIDPVAWQAQFLSQWPEGSDAHAAYFGRLTRGPTYRLDEAVRFEE